MKSLFFNVNYHSPVLLQDKELSAVYRLLSCSHVGSVCVQNFGARFE